ncbi:MGMT family protein [Halioxenophilus aromaticivorans]|uniref:Methylated-DNA-[protein]-cysteine S-methyltransferase DNA binding domain-containing protein n=1 Tax=Halioxenophilus aromaticivorans TaxID=1306992 RepID=A0AAV3TYM6_9ALTE
MGPESALYLAISQVPSGRVCTYGAIARLAGLPNRARWVGRILSRLPQDSTLPWHRIINSQGRISLPGERGSFQRQRLEQEGITFRNDRVNLRQFGWNLHPPSN